MERDRRKLFNWRIGIDMHAVCLIAVEIIARLILGCFKVRLPKAQNAALHACVLSDGLIEP